MYRCIRYNHASIDIQVKQNSCGVIMNFTPYSSTVINGSYLGCEL